MLSYCGDISHRRILGPTAELTALYFEREVLFEAYGRENAGFWDAMDVRPSSWVASAMCHKLLADRECYPKPPYFRVIGGMGPDGEREGLFRPEGVR